MPFELQSSGSQSNGVSPFSYSAMSLVVASSSTSLGLLSLSFPHLLVLLSALTPIISSWDVLCRKLNMGVDGLWQVSKFKLIPHFVDSLLIHV